MTKHLDDEALVDFSRRWSVLWTEADPQARSRQVVELWAPAGAQVLVDPPQAMRDAATELAFPVPRLEVRGHDEIERRVAQAYALFVEPGEYTFRAAGRRAAFWHPRSSGWHGRWSPSLTGPSPGAATTCSYSMMMAASCSTTSTS